MTESAYSVGAVWHVVLVPDAWLGTWHVMKECDRAGRQGRHFFPHTLISGWHPLALVTMLVIG